MSHISFLQKIQRITGQESPDPDMSSDLAFLDEVAEHTNSTPERPDCMILEDDFRLSVRKTRRRLSGPHDWGTHMVRVACGSPGCVTRSHLVILER